MRNGAIKSKRWRYLQLRLRMPFQMTATLRVCSANKFRDMIYDGLSMFIRSRRKNQILSPFHTAMPTLHWHLINENGDIISLCIPVCCKMFHRYIEARQTKGVHATNFCENLTFHTVRYSLRSWAHVQMSEHAVCFADFSSARTSSKPTTEKQKRDVRDLYGR